MIPHDNDIVLQDWNEYPVEEDLDFMEVFQHVINNQSMPEQDDNFTSDVFDDTYLHMEIALPRGGDQEDTQFAKVVKQLHNKEERLIGVAKDNPMLDTHEYEVEFLDGHHESLSCYCSTLVVTD